MHWMNSAFQTLYFIIGKCHTPDEAYRVALSQLEDRECTLFEAENKYGPRYAQLTNRATFNPEAMSPIEKRDHNSMIVLRREAEFLREIARRLEPMRLYRDLDLNDANQLAQRDQWRLEFMQRAENSIYATGGVQAAELEAMRLHPDFDSAILPHIEKIVADYKADGKPKGITSPVTKLMNTIEYDAKLRLTHQARAA